MTRVPLEQRPADLGFLGRVYCGLYSLGVIRINITRTSLSVEITKGRHIADDHD